MSERDWREEILTLLCEIRDRLDDQNPPFKDQYTPAQFEQLPGVTIREFTIREHCRNKRIRARKAPSGRGLHTAWLIPHSSYEYYVSYGLLPPGGHFDNPDDNPGD